MKIIRTLHFLLAALALTFSAGAAEKREVLNLFCWSEYVPQSVIEAFTKETGIKVNVENYDSNEKMLAKLLAGGAKYDLIQPSEYVVESLIKQGRLEELNRANLPNFKNLDAKFTDMAHDPGNKFSVPWIAGSVGIACGARSTGTTSWRWMACERASSETPITPCRNSAGTARPSRGRK